MLDYSVSSDLALHDSATLSSNPLNGSDMSNHATALLTDPPTAPPLPVETGTNLIMDPAHPIVTGISTIIEITTNPFWLHTGPTSLPESNSYLEAPSLISDHTNDAAISTDMLQAIPTDIHDLSAVTTADAFSPDMSYCGTESTPATPSMMDSIQNMMIDASVHIGTAMATVIDMGSNPYWHLIDPVPPSTPNPYDEIHLDPVYVV